MGKLPRIICMRSFLIHSFPLFIKSVFLACNPHCPIASKKKWGSIHWLLFRTSVLSQSFALNNFIPYTYFPNNSCSCGSISQGCQPNIDLSIITFIYLCLLLLGVVVLLLGQGSSHLPKHTPFHHLGKNCPFILLLRHHSHFLRPTSSPWIIYPSKSRSSISLMLLMLTYISCNAIFSWVVGSGLIILLGANFSLSRAHNTHIIVYYASHQSTAISISNNISNKEELPFSNCLFFFV